MSQPDPSPRYTKRVAMYLIGFIFLIGGSLMTLTDKPMAALAMCFAALCWFIVARIVTS